MDIKQAKQILWPDFENVSDELLKKLIELFQAYSRIAITQRIKAGREEAKKKRGI